MKRTGVRSGCGKAIKDGDQVAPHPKHPLRWTVHPDDDGDWVATLNDTDFPQTHTTYLTVGTWWVFRK